MRSILNVAFLFVVTLVISAATQNQSSETQKCKITGYDAFQLMKSFDSSDGDWSNEGSVDSVKVLDLVLYMGLDEYFINVNYADYAYVPYICVSNNDELVHHVLLVITEQRNKQSDFITLKRIYDGLSTLLKTKYKDCVVVESNESYCLRIEDDCSNTIELLLSIKNGCIFLTYSSAAYSVAFNEELLHNNRDTQNML